MDELGAIPVSGETLGYQLTPNCLCHSVGAAMHSQLSLGLLKVAADCFFAKRQMLRDLAELFAQ